jgi:DNA-binding winged helix-turn-helix (wHTH) protein/predicted Zn-dependent protease
MAGAVQFGPFEFDPARRELRKHGLKIRVPDQSLEILTALVERPGETLTREQIRTLLWPDGTAVEFERSINAAVKVLRQALGDSADTARFVERVPRQGYRFVAPVSPVRRPDENASAGVPPPGMPAEERPLRWYSRWRAALVALIAAGMTAVAVITWFWTRPAQALAERDVVVIADFENQTNDEVLGGALGQALLAQMGESRYLRVMSVERSRSALALMGRASGARLTPDVAREVCQRSGGKAVVAGMIGALGGQYFIALRAFGCANGEALASEYIQAESRGRILASLSRAASDLRARLGESMASIRKPSVPVEASTPSLEALNAYSIALAEKATGNDPIPFLQRAAELDPEFVAAHFTMAQVYLNRGRQTEAEDAISKAYALRGRASERERLAVENFYHVVATGDLPQAIAAGALASRLYPHEAAARRSTFLPCALAGDLDSALRVARAELEQAPDEGVSYFNAAVLLLGFGKSAEAKATLSAAAVRGVGYDLFPFARYIAAALDGDSAAMDREAEAARGRPFEDGILMLQVQMAGYSGQLARARDIAGKAARRDMSNAPAIGATVALTEAVFGLGPGAKARARAVIRLDRGRRAAATSALALALANDPALAQALVDDLLRRYPHDTLLSNVWLPAVRGAIAAHRGDARAALEAADPPIDTARYAWPAYIRGLTYLKLGHGSDAAAQFRTIIERKPHLFTSTFVYGAAFAYPAALLGLARALAVEGKVEESRQAYDKFFSVWNHADSDIPLLAQARMEYAALARVPAAAADR